MVPVLSLACFFDFKLPVGVAGLARSDGLPLAGVMPEIEEAVDDRLPPLGGWGNAAMLIVLRRVLSGLLGVRPVDADLNAARLEVELVCTEPASEGRGEAGARSLDGWEGDGTLGVSDATDRVFFALDVGSCGRDVFVAGRDG